MKILHIPTGGLFSDGILNCITDYMKEMDKTTFDIRVLATNIPDKETIKKIELSGCKIFSIPYRKKNLIKYFFLLYSYIKREKIDIVHIHGSSALMSVELVAARIAKCKVRIAHSHNTTCSHQLVDKFLRPIFNKTYTVAFACGQDAGKWLFNNHKFTIIPNGRDIKKYEFNPNNRINYRNKLNIPSNALVVGHVGRFNIQKNHEYLIRIFEELFKNNKNCYLVLVGTGNTAEKIKNQVKNSFVRNNVIFTGVIDNVEDYLSAFDVMLLPSLFEGLPTVVIEWQIAGLPCLVSDLVTTECAITKLVKFMSITESPSIWAREIESISLKDREKNKLSLFCSIRTAGYDIELCAERLRKIYIDLIKSS